LTLREQTSVFTVACSRAFYFQDFLITLNPKNEIPDNNAFKRFEETRSHTECDLQRAWE